MSEIGLFYLGVRILSPTVLARVQKYSIAARMVTGRDAVIIRQEDLHITIIPPYYCSHEAAVALNRLYLKLQYERDNIIRYLTFSIRQPTLMEFDDEVATYFEVRTKRGLEIAFQEWVTEQRQRVTTLDGFSWKKDIPTKVKPHVTADIIKKEELTQAGRDALRRVVESAPTSPPVTFQLACSTICERRGNSWRPIIPRV
ncbi:MAG: hypothetical protein JWN37_190 [Candidatus Nomurabacteria bacterium]|nr:hypothetical protein [Candidatus Nomurabacteria bacterium]